MSIRAGRYVHQLTCYKSFVPAPLPPKPTIQYDQELINLLSEANRELGRLDGIAVTLTNPDLFVAMYVKKEAVLSSQIEGTQASLVDILEFGIEQDKRLPQDIGEVVNYVDAMNYGLERLQSLPLSLRLIKEIHHILLNNTRGAEKSPGDFRNSQNWIGSAGCTLSTATFVPPNVDDMKQAMGELELYMHQDDDLPWLLKVALIHCQFETIHPFLDGNGRIGRLLITFLLCEKNILNKPLLYLSHYFKQNRSDYYDFLMKVRNKGDWEGWLKFFLKGVVSVSQQAILTSRNILDLQFRHRSLVMEKNSSNALRLLDLLYYKPILNVGDALGELGLSFPTINNLFNLFEELGILHEKTGQQRNRVYEYSEYVQLLY